MQSNRQRPNVDAPIVYRSEVQGRLDESWSSWFDGMTFTVESSDDGKIVTVQAVCREVWLRDFNQKVKVVVIVGLKKPIILFSTDLTLSMAQIIEIYGARFVIELAIRDLKGYLGLADYQCYLTTAIHRFVHLACVAFCLYRLIQFKEDTSAWLPPVPKGTSPASFAHLRQGLQHFIIGRILSPKFGEIPNLKDNTSELQAILRIAA